MCTTLSLTGPREFYQRGRLSQKKPCSDAQSRLTEHLYTCSVQNNAPLLYHDSAINEPMHLYTILTDMVTHRRAT